MTQQLVSFEEKPEGLVITVLGPEERAEIMELAGMKEVVDSHGRMDIVEDESNPHSNESWASRWGELIEDQLCNGWEWPSTIDLGALMDEDQPFLSQNIERDDHGEITEIGDLYLHNEFAIEDPLTVLLREGSVVFIRAIKKGENPWYEEES